MKQDNKEAALK